MDRIEQDSLSDALKLDGPIAKQLIEKHNSDPEKDRANLKKIIIAEINKVKSLKVNSLDISDAFIVGKNSKHIKLVFKSANKKQEVLRTFKNCETLRSLRKRLSDQETSQSSLQTEENRINKSERQICVQLLWKHLLQISEQHKYILCQYHCCILQLHQGQ